MADLAQSTFTHALCTCGAYTATAPLAVDGMDSRDGSSGGLPADVGINGLFTSHGALQTSGDLTLADNGHITGDMAVGGTLSSHGTLRCGSDVTVMGDARFAGLTSVDGTLSVDGNTVLSPNATLVVRGGHAPTPITQPLTIAEPCACDANAQVPIVSLVAAHASENDNVFVHLRPNDLRGMQHSAHIRLPSGHYYFNGISSTEDITMVAEGRVAVFVNGDITGNRAVRIASAHGGQLDLFVTGNIKVADAFFFGNVSTPARARLYLLGTAISGSNSVRLGGNVYAPNANVSLSHATRVYGSLWTQDLAHSSPLEIIYDAAVRENPR